MFDDGLVDRLRAWHEELGEEATPSRLATFTKIYVIKCCEFIKIGHAHAPERRLSEMRIGCPYPMDLLHVIEARFYLERLLHRRFKRHRERGEWFRIEGDVKTWIDGGFPLPDRNHGNSRVNRHNS